MIFACILYHPVIPSAFISWHATVRRGLPFSVYYVGIYLLTRGLLPPCFLPLQFMYQRNQATCHVFHLLGFADYVPELTYKLVARSRDMMRLEFLKTFLGPEVLHR